MRMGLMLEWVSRGSFKMLKGLKSPVIEHRYGFTNHRQQFLDLGIKTWSHCFFEREMKPAADKIPTKVSATPILGIESSSASSSSSDSISGFPSQGIQ